MNEITQLPPELESNIGPEHKDFVVKAKRKNTKKSSFSAIFFWICWLGFTSIFLFAFFGPLFISWESRFTTNGEAVVATMDNLWPLIWPGIFMSIFVLVWLVALISGIVSFFKKWGYFVWTQTRLITYRKWKIHSIDWEQFNWDIKVNINQNKWDISLWMRTWKIVRRNDRNRYVPDVIHMVCIPNIIDVERSCRKRIKENDPTPSK